jgi:prepilin-type N-terminal cleavage/methylation domain-containing protein
MKRIAPPSKNEAGFSLLELMVTVLIMAILAGIFSQTLPFVKALFRDHRRTIELANLQRVIEIYKADTGAFPATLQDPNVPGVYLSFFSEDDAFKAQYNPAQVSSNYVPAVSPTYYEKLPPDPLPGESTDPNCVALGGYKRTLAYFSSGDHYKLVYHCASEHRTIRPDDDFADPGRCLGDTCWAWAASDNIILTTSYGW